MKGFRKGFTLVELLIVIAILGAMSAMMATSSSESIDAASASAILNNLQTMKAAAFEMYMEEPKVASDTAITTEKSITIKEAVAADSANGIEAQDAVTKKVGEVLGERLGRKDIATGYGIVGDKDHWYVYYTITADDSANVKAKLKDSANAAGLYGGASAEASAFTTYYTGTQDFVALMVR